MNIVRKIEDFLFYFLLFAVPFQTRKILWQQNWYFNEWQAITLYATDLLFLILLFFWVFNWKTDRNLLGNRVSKWRFLFKIQKFDYFIFAFLAVSAISIKNSSSPTISSFQFLKLFEFVLFYFYIKSYAFYRFNFSKALLAIFAGGVFQSIIAIGQFLKQSDLGLRILGESILGPTLSGVASFFNSAGEKVIRAYGTTPHSNILAAYLFIAIFAFYFLFLYKKNHVGDWSLLAGYFVMLFGLFFTFSRTIIFLWVAGFVARAGLILFKKDFRTKFWGDPLMRRRLVLISITTVIAIGIFMVVYWPDVVSRSKLSADDEAVQLRIFYGKESLKAGLNLFGFGVGNFVNWFMKIDTNLPRYLYQPVHNIYLLMYSEVGLLGVSSFILFLIFLIRNFINRTKMKELFNFSFLLVFISFLMIGFFDHFLFTIQQGRFIFWLVAALIAVSTVELPRQKQEARNP